MTSNRFIEMLFGTAITMLIGVISGIKCITGLLICLLSESETPLHGIIIGSIGLLMLFAAFVLWRKLAGKQPQQKAKS